ncbi:hypothetical protein HPP92_006290 [Vanilla planifolia]|uniref:Uncharacterized protein n=1 Tax=Vanilla planifolia TaxID=51239 RepID=A0A835VBR5_VANPL|nr:hypothetical protein HPP92_006290 [Vanilla planifolia]
MADHWLSPLLVPGFLVGDVSASAGDADPSYCDDVSLEGLQEELEECKDDEIYQKCSIGPCSSRFPLSSPSVVSDF